MAAASAALTISVEVRFTFFTSSRLPGTLRNLIMPDSGRKTSPQRAAMAMICPITCSRYGSKTFQTKKKLDTVTTQPYRPEATA